jgi:3-(3-hydroxy-phenyl)propionate hydroxylase
MCVKGAPEPAEIGGTKCLLPSECGDDGACGGDRRRWSDRADAGSRAGAGGSRRRHRRAARQPGARRLRAQAVSTPAPSKCLTRQALVYRDRRVLLAGDAAHVHPPVGGQGLNIGVQDAVNLGWKLAQVIKRISADSLLDTYHAERHPVAARVLRATRWRKSRFAVLTNARRPRPTTAQSFFSMDEPRKRLAAEMTGLDIRYDLGEGHPLLGRRVPDLDLVTINGPLRAFTLLHDARPVLLNLGEPGSLEITPWADRVQPVDARYVGTWELQAIGAITAPAAVLIRPDGYVAWVGDRAQLGLAVALTTWLGSPAAAPRTGFQEHSVKTPA